MIDKAIELAQVALAFGRVDRATFHEDGITPESDTDHTVMLGLLAVGLLDELAPGLDRGQVAMLALVHDLVEVYASDTCTLRALDPQQKTEKARREAAALQRLGSQFISSMPAVIELIQEYEQLRTPEARYVKAVDKLLPKMVALLNGFVTPRQQGVAVDELRDRYELQRAEIISYAGDFPRLIEFRDQLTARFFAEFEREVARS